VPTINENALNNAVWDSIQRAMLNPNVIADGVKRQQAAQVASTETAAVEQQQIQKAMAQIEMEESRLLDAYRTGVISPAQLGQELEKTKSRHRALDNGLAELSDRQQVIPSLEIGRTVADYCRMAAEAMARFDGSERQNFLRLLHLEVVFTGTQVRIKGRLPTGEVSPPIPKPRGLGPVTPSNGRIAATGISLSGLNPGGENRYRHSTILNGVHGFRCSFDLEESVVVVPPPQPRRADGQFFSKAELRSIVLAQLLAVAAMRRAPSTVPKVPGVPS